MELLDKLGVDWRLLVAQIANFTILLFVLVKVLYKPLTQMLENRRKTIEKGLSDAEEAKVARNRAESEKQLILAEARREALEIINHARADVEEVKQKLIQEGQAEKLQLIQNGREQAQQEKNNAMKEAEVSVGELVVELTKKLIGSVLTKEQDKKLGEQVYKIPSS